MYFPLPLLVLSALAISATAAPAPAPISDCASLKSLAITPGGKLFCATKYPAASAAVAPVDGAPKNNARRFVQDDERVVRVLGGMPEQRQRAFCACYPVAAEGGV